jgi:colicin import membrane protein
MNRLQKKCMVFSLGLHGLLAVILLASAGFGAHPQQTDLQIMTVIPANIVDRAGAGGGTPAVRLAPQPQSPPQQQQPQPQPQAVRAEPVERAPRPTPRQRQEPERPAPAPEPSEDAALESKPKPSKRHEVQVSYTPASAATSAKKTSKTHSSDASASSARADARRLKEIRTALADLAAGVQSSGSPNTIVDVGGIGGGEAFAGYRDVVFSAYYHAWTTPDNTASRMGLADARVVIARDGSIISAELSHSSGDRALDKSVEQALRRVTKLPPFPASARDAQRTFLIRFSLEAKEMSG